MTLKYDPPADRSHETQSIKGKLILLFYLLTRDHVPTGILFNLIGQVKETVPKPAVFSSPGILQVAKEFVSDLFAKGELEAHTFILDKLTNNLEGSSLLMAALMGRLNQREVEFTDQQLMAIKDAGQQVWVEQSQDPSKGCSVTKLVLKMPMTEIKAAPAEEKADG